MEICQTQWAVLGIAVGSRATGLAHWMLSNVHVSTWLSLWGQLSRWNVLLWTCTLCTPESNLNVYALFMGNLIQSVVYLYECFTQLDPFTHAYMSVLLRLNINLNSIYRCVFGKQLDLHSGGIDLHFPHHENEISQCEAHYCAPQWTNYWLHTGKLSACEYHYNFEPSARNRW